MSVRKQGPTESRIFDLIAPLLVAALCSAISVFWAIRVPIFESPDETAHADYALELYDVGHPFTVRDPRPHTFVTAQSRYIAKSIGYREMRYNPAARVPMGYGTPTYFKNLDRGAPPRIANPPGPASTMPYVMFAYPIGYYAVVASMMSLAGNLIHDSLSTVFFVGRFANSLFLFLTVLLAYRIFLTLRLGRVVAMLATLGVGLFPLVSAVSGAIQPDGLALLLSTGILYSALSFRKRPQMSYVVSLSVLCSTLFFVKQHNALAFWLPVLFLVGTSWWGHRRKLTLTALYLVLIPSIAFAGSFVLTPVRGLRDPQRFIHDTVSHAASPAGYGLMGLVNRFIQGLTSLYGGGTAFWSYWLQFGFRGATFVPSGSSQALSTVLLCGTFAVAVALLARQISILRRIYRVFSKNSRHGALLLLAADVPKNVYLCVLLILLVIYVGTGITLQGRYMLVTLVPLAIVLLKSIPNQFRPRSRKRIRLGIAGSMAFYSLVLCGFGIHAIDANYYERATTPLRIDTLADVDFATSKRRSLNLDSPIAIARAEAVNFSGHAIDMRTGLPAEEIVVAVDGRTRAVGHTGLARIDVASIFADEALDRCGFAITLPFASLHRGYNRIDFYVKRRDDFTQLAFRRSFQIDVR